MLTSLLQLLKYLAKVLLLCYNIFKNKMKNYADIAQLVERWLPKPKVAGSNPVVRSIFLPEITGIIAS